MVRDNKGKLGRMKENKWLKSLILLNYPLVPL